MFRFTIRDLLWLMVVVGCLLGWSGEYVERRGVVKKLAETHADLQAEQRKHFDIHVGDVTGTVKRKQRMLVSIDEGGRVEFRPISENDLQKIDRP